MPTVTIDYDKAGYITNQVEPVTNWLTQVRNVSTGTSVSNHTADESANGTGRNIETFYGSGRSGAVGRIRRAYFLFNNFGTGVQGNITGITFRFARDSGTSTLNAMQGFKSTHTSGTYATSDFGDVDFNTEYVSSFTMTNSSAGTQDLTLNSSAVTDANSNGLLSIAVVIEKFDGNGSSLSLNSQITARPLFGSSNNPTQLVITYNDPSYGNNVIGVSSGNIASVKGVATADIASVIGVS